MAIIISFQGNGETNGRQQNRQSNCSCFKSSEWAWIAQAFDNCSVIHINYNNTAKEAPVKMKLSMLEDVRKLKPFYLTPGKSQNSFPTISPHVTSHLNEGDLLTWLQSHKQQVVTGFFPWLWPNHFPNDERTSSHNATIRSIFKMVARIFGVFKSFYNYDNR